jgi:hypothetical protein
MTICRCRGRHSQSAVVNFGDTARTGSPEKTGKIPGRVRAERSDRLDRSPISAFRSGRWLSFFLSVQSFRWAKKQTSDRSDRSTDVRFFTFLSAAWRSFVSVRRICPSFPPGQRRQVARARINENAMRTQWRMRIELSRSLATKFLRLRRSEKGCKMCKIAAFSFPVRALRILPPNLSNLTAALKAAGPPARLIANAIKVQWRAVRLIANAMEMQ